MRSYKNHQRYRVMTKANVSTVFFPDRSMFTEDDNTQTFGISKYILKNLTKA